MVLPVGAIFRGVMGIKDVKQLDVHLAALEQRVAVLPEVRPGLLAGLAGRDRAEAALRLLLVEAEVQRHLGVTMAEYERKIGEMVMEVRELQLKDTPATKWDVDELARRLGELAEAFRSDMAGLEAKADGNSRAIEDLKSAARANEGEVAALKDLVAARVRVFAVVLLIAVLGASSGIYMALTR